MAISTEKVLYTAIDARSPQSNLKVWFSVK